MVICIAVELTDYCSYRDGAVVGQANILQKKVFAADVVMQCASLVRRETDPSLLGGVNSRSE